jgi:hypothetical protein
MSVEQFDTGARIAVLENEIKNIVGELKELRVEQKEQHQLLMQKFSHLEDRLSNLEKWRWMLLGGAAVVGYLVSHFSILK